jgi:hypothetical protein
MARQRRYNAFASGGVGGERSSLGDTHVETAITTLNHLCAKTIAKMVEFKPEREQLLTWLFDDYMLECLRKVKGHINTSSDIGYYKLATDTMLHIDFTGASVPTIAPSTLGVNPDRAGPLLEAIAEIKVIHEQFEVTKHVLRWLNRNATPGAIRYYFPPVLALCPHSPALAELQHTPVRFTTPEGIADQLPLIREAANVAASAALMEKDAPTRVRDKVWLTFTGYKFRRLQGSEVQTGVMGAPEIVTDQRAYYL